MGSEKKGNTIIVGAGWAGLAAAVELAHQGKSVTVLESARQTGGRARSISAMQDTLDNGQHIMLGAYQHFLRLLQKIGVDVSTVLERLPLELRSVSSLNPRDRFTLRAPFLPAPLHLLWALLFAKGLGMGDKWSAIRFWQCLQKQDFTLAQDITLRALFQQHGQSRELISKLWEPLCIAALNTPIDTASAQVFITVLHRSFSGRRSNSDLLLPNSDLGSIVPDPAVAFIQDKGGRVLTGNRVTQLMIEQGCIHGVQCGESQFLADHVILATSPMETARLLQAHEDLSPVAHQLERFTYEPIYTLYLRYPVPFKLPLPMIGLRDSTAQWIFDRSLCGQNGVLSVVISASGPHEQLDETSLCARVQQEIRMLNPQLPEPLEHFLIREKRATFSCTPEINRIRPENHTPIDGLWLAGDYTRTNLPATLEGAVQSGVQCAHCILSSLN